MSRAAALVLFWSSICLVGQQADTPGFSFGSGASRVPMVADELDVAKVRPYDQVLMTKFNKVWFAFRERYALTEDGLFIPSQSGADPSPDTPESQVAFLHHLSREPVKVTYRHSVKCEDCRGTGRKFVYEGLSATELTHVVCGGTGLVDALIVCKLSYTGTPPPRLPSANQRAYAAALKLAESDNALAALEVADRLASGKGVTRHLASASEWYLKALMRGEPKAAGRLATMYERGEVGFELNKPFAVALAMLGREMGGGDASLDQLARNSSSLEVLKGHWYGQTLLGARRAGRLNESLLKPKALDAAIMRRFDEILVAARRDDKLATFDVGMIQLCGLGAGGVDAPAAFGWFTKAAKAGNPLAYFALGSHFEAGVAVRKSRPAAFALYRVSLSLGQEFPAAQAAKGLEPYCSDPAIGARLDELLAKVRDGSIVASDISGLVGLPDVDVPVVVASTPTPVADPGPARGPGGKPLGPIVQSGSGMIFTSDGHFFTNHHVVENCTYITVRANGSSIERRAILVAADPARDLAILRIVEWRSGEIPYPTPSLLRSAAEESQLGMRVFTIGFPMPDLLNSTPKYAGGDLNSTQGGSGEKSHFMQVSCPIQPGNSGGPLVLEDGRVAGVICATLAMRSQNANFAIRIEYLRQLAEKYGVFIPSASARVVDPVPSIQSHCVQVLCRK